jgi:phosphoribosylanthranilate isomerase
MTEPSDMAASAALWIKICGLTSAAGIAAAVGAGADAVGFVFAPSRRRVSAAQAAELGRAVPGHVARIAVMQHPTQTSLDEVWQVFRPDVLQTDWSDLSSLHVPAGLAVMPVLRAGQPMQGVLPGRMLLEGAVSGAGLTTDWSLAAQLARRTQLVLAGGLNLGNVAQAIAQVCPFGIDVSSGVESAPGQKDPALIEQFIGAARSAQKQQPAVAGQQGH